MLIDPDPSVLADFFGDDGTGLGPDGIDDDIHDVGGTGIVGATTANKALATRVHLMAEDPKLELEVWFRKRSEAMWFRPDVAVATSPEHALQVNYTYGQPSPR